ncbi:hypothetical protein DFH09DRAFT_1370535 [Mycena vulgaris]|nr:hypothetical protein DFH09DRAFT_1370535 [Mycena vulgaris]
MFAVTKQRVLFASRVLFVCSRSLARTLPEMPPRSKDSEVQRVHQDVRDVVEGLDPDVRNRWFRFKPDSNGSKKAAFSPLPSPNKPKKRKLTEEAESDSSIEVLDDKPTKKKKRKVKHTAKVDDDDDEPVEAVDMSVYLYVQTPAPPVLAVRGRPAKPLPPQSTELGPWLFKSSISYEDFLEMLAKGCRTKAENLPLSDMTWKFDRPNNAKSKTLSNETAYKVMIKSLVDRHKDFVFSVFMPPPTAVKKELPWKIDEDEGNGGGAPLNFEYNLDGAAAGPSSALSIRQQIAGIDNSSNPYFVQLIEAYPVDNCPLFPGKRIYHNETGYFDLTDIKLRVWSVACAKGIATIEKPPVSNHFAKNQTIRPPKADNALVPAAALVPTPAPAPVLTSDSLLSLLFTNPNMLNMMNPMFLPSPYGHMPQPHHAPAQPFGFAIPPQPQPAPAQPLQLPVAALPRDISIEEYFDRYKTTPDDRRVLSELGYIPGDSGIDDLTDSDWKATKVSPLARGRILRQHAAFLDDVSKGKWD